MRPLHHGLEKEELLGVLFFISFSAKGGGFWGICTDKVDCGTEMENQMIERAYRGMSMHSG